MTDPVRIGIIGSAWRADFFARLAAMLPEQLTLVGAAVRRPESAEHVRRDWGVTAYLSPAELMAGTQPELVVTSVPRAVNAEILGDLAQRGMHVLSETPPAADEAALYALWDRVGGCGLVQVAEQYPRYPGHQARAELVRRGTIGQATSVHVSSTHDYHAVALMRRFLGAGFADVRACTASFTAPLADPLSRAGWTGDDQPRPARTLLATIDFGGVWGLYDFTDNQWHNRLRLRRILIRGSHGEIADDTVVRLAAARTVLTSPIIRSQLGYDLNLDGYDTEQLSFDGAVLYRNPFLGLRLMDDEIAIASVLTAAARWARDEGPGPYPLAEACHDHLISLAIHQSATEGAPVRTKTPPWAR
jgi:predicted dehydrogenase